MRAWYRKILLHIAGQFTQHLITQAVLWGIVFSLRIAMSDAITMAMVLFASRLFLRLRRGDKPVFEDILIRKKIRWVVEDETKIMLVFLAIGFVLSWPLTTHTIGLLVFINIGCQLLGLGLTRQLLLYLKYDFVLHGGSKKVVVIGSGPKAKRVINRLLDSPETDTELIGIMDFKRTGLWRYRDIPLIGHPDDLSHLTLRRQIDAVIFAVENDELLFAEHLFEKAEELGVTVCDYTVAFKAKVFLHHPGYVSGLPMMIYHRVPKHQAKLFIKTVFDRTLAAIALILGAPVLGIIAIAIKLDSKGPVLFKQNRSGLNGKLFPLYKFRTMCTDADKLKAKLQDLNEMSGPVFKITNDPRVTRIGKLLRKSSLDELPQLLNVVRGEMSLVGPRPPLPKEVAEYQSWQHRRLSVKPGITCTWQVNGRNRIDFEDWMKLDLEYIDNWSLWNDAKIIARTVPAVLKGDGAS